MLRDKVMFCRALDPRGERVMEGRSTSEPASRTGFLTRKEHEKYGKPGAFRVVNKYNLQGADCTDDKDFCITLAAD